MTQFLVNQELGKPSFSEIELRSQSPTDRKIEREHSERLTRLCEIDVAETATRTMFAPL
jgi:hypothetical protein